MSPVSAYARSPDTLRARAKSAQPRCSSRSTWSSGGKPNSGGSPKLLITTFADSSGPTGAPGHGVVGVSSIRAVSASLVSASCSRSDLSWASSFSCSIFSSARRPSSARAYSLDELFLKAWAWSSSVCSLRLSRSRSSSSSTSRLMPLTRTAALTWSGCSLMNRLSSMGTRQPLCLLRIACQLKRPARLAYRDTRAADQPRPVRRPDRCPSPPPGAGLRGRGGLAFRARRGAALGGRGEHPPVPPGGGARRADRPDRDGDVHGAGPARAPPGRAGGHDRRRPARPRQADQGVVRLDAVAPGGG